MICGVVLEMDIETHICNGKIYGKLLSEIT